MIESINSPKTIKIMAMAITASVLCWIGCFFPYINMSLLHVDCSVYILGAKTILSGGIPYKNFADHKPPGIYFIYSLILNVFGSKNYTAVNTFGLFFTLVSTGLLFLITKKFLNRFAAAIAIAVYPLISVVLMGRDAINPNTEIFMETFSLAGIFFVLIFSQSKKKASFYIPGLLFGLASTIKQPAMFTFLAGIFAITIFSATEKLYSVIPKRIIYFVAGFFTVWMFTCMYFFMNGVFSDFWFYCFKFNFIYSSIIPKKMVLSGLISLYHEFFFKYPFVFAPYFLAIVLYVVIFWKERYTKYFFSSLFVIIWHLMDTAGISLGGIFYPHYLIQWIPSLIVFVLIPFYYFVTRLEFLKKRIEIIVVVFAVVLAGKILMGDQVEKSKPGDAQNYVSPVSAYISIRDYAKVFGSDFLQYPYYYNPKMFYETKSLVSIIRDNTPEDNPFFVFGFMPELYLLVDRPPASRFVYTGFITGCFTALGNLMEMPQPQLAKFHNRLSAALIRDLDKNMPKVIVCVPLELNVKPAGFFSEYLAKYYDKLQRKSGINLEVYIRKTISNNE